MPYITYYVKSPNIDFRFRVFDAEKNVGIWSRSFSLVVDRISNTAPHPPVLTHGEKVELLLDVDNFLDSGEKPACWDVRLVGPLGGVDWDPTAKGYQPSLFA